MASDEEMSTFRAELIEQSFQVGALKFGEFTLKSGRISPYFFNAGLLSTGPILATVSSAYAATIARGLADAAGPLPAFDVLFGPAYKGIPLAATTAVALHREHALGVGVAFDRKEAKDHGEGGKIVGVDVRGRRVLVLDDVMTSGKAVREGIATVQAAGGEVVGVVLLLDREEVGKHGEKGTVQELEDELGGKGKVRVILRMRDLTAWLEGGGRGEDVARMQEYWDKYGVKNA